MVVLDEIVDISWDLDLNLDCNRETGVIAVADVDTSRSSKVVAS